MEKLTRKILQTIDEIHYNKVSENIEPSFVVFREIIEQVKDRDLAEVREALRELYRQGVIRWGNTINDFYFERQ